MRLNKVFNRLRVLRPNRCKKYTDLQILLSNQFGIKLLKSICLNSYIVEMNQYELEHVIFSMSTTEITKCCVLVVKPVPRLIFSNSTCIIL